MAYFLITSVYRQETLARKFGASLPMMRHCSSGNVNYTAKCRFVLAVGNWGAVAIVRPARMPEYLTLASFFHPILRYNKIFKSRFTPLLASHARPNGGGHAAKGRERYAGLAVARLGAGQVAPAIPPPLVTMAVVRANVVI